MRRCWRLGAKETRRDEASREADRTVVSARDRTVDGDAQCVITSRCIESGGIGAFFLPLPISR